MTPRERLNRRENNVKMNLTEHEDESAEQMIQYRELHGQGDEP